MLRNRKKETRNKKAQKNDVLNKEEKIEVGSPRFMNEV